jgi:hypothetical protein
MQSIADLVATSMNQLEVVRLAEPGGEPGSCGLRSRELNAARRNQCAHAHIRRKRAGEPPEVTVGKRRDKRRTRISS